MDGEFLIAFAAIGMPLFLVPTIISLRQAHRRREWEHQERMRAMELGLLPTGSRASSFWPSLAAAAIGAGVPIAAFFFCFLTSVIQGGDDHWAAAAVVGFVSVICGTVLTSQILAGRKADRAQADDPAPNKAPLYDPDAYDTVGRRG